MKATHEKFTTKGLSSLKPKATRYDVWEKGKTGFGIRVSPRGIKTFVWMYRYEGKLRRLTLGHYPAMPLYEAHKILAIAQEKLAHGVDPGNEAVQERRAHREAMLVEDLVQEYLERYARPNKRSAKVDERMLRKDVLPKWGKMKAKNVTKKDVIKLLDEICTRGAPIIANRTLACIRKMFNWAHSRDLLDTTPCFGIKAPSRENHRDRVLNKTEIALLWNNLLKTKMTELMRLAIKFQLVTAQRKAEILNAQWSDFDFSNNVWTIPMHLAKNGLSHRVPLSSLALELLSKIRILNTDALGPFFSKQTAQCIHGSSVDHALRKNRDILQIDNVIPHDLRRTAASHMASQGINRLVISKILNHVEQSVTSVYDRYSYDQEKRDALEIWGKFLTGMIGGEKSEHK